MNLDDNNGTTVVHRTTGHKPRKSWSTLLIGRPLPTADAPHQTIGRLIGLAVFSSDALSSVAYATQEMLIILALAGASAFSYSIPLAIATCVLLVILTLSYEQTIHAYPRGGGSYIVSRDNLGAFPALVAGAALLTDYILTVAVSISSGTAQLISAIPSLVNYKIWIAIAMVVFIMVMNLRGVKESGAAFSIPTYFFVVMMYLMVGIGLFRLIAGSLGTVVNPPMDLMAEVAQPLTLFLILRAFSSGTSAVTGIEAISDGITAFKEPRSKTAGQTLIMMAVILGSLLLGITILANQMGALPSEHETIISQMARTIFGDRNLGYILVISATTVILMMAANTAFADFPRLSAITAADGFLPRQMTYRGSRLVYSRGIVALALIAILLIVLFNASVTRLIPLYAIGVFLSFTLSQLGMALRWRKSGKLAEGEELKEKGSTLTFEKNWFQKMIINGFGALITLTVLIIFTVTKFSEGAYIVVILIPVLVAVFWSIHHHYEMIAKQLSLDHVVAAPRVVRQRVIIPISGVHQGSLAGLRYARTLSDDITAVHVSVDPEEAIRVQQKWEKWGEGYRLVILDSPYRLFIEPLLEYIDEIDAQRIPNEVITIVVPFFVPRNPLANGLHTRTAAALRNVLLGRKDIVIIEVPYQVD